MSRYAVKEIFYTLQGEGAHGGRPAVFCRFAGCNLWSGREADRETAQCRFCDTDFVGTDAPDGGRFADAQTLAATIDSLWPASAGVEGGVRYVVFTGGEPLLQLDADLIAAMHALGWTVAVETNGTLPAPPGIDWICVSPKAGTELVQRSGDEIKLVFPHEGAAPEHYGTLAFRHFFLQPMDGPRLRENTKSAVAYCMAHPRWHLSLQTHKILDIR